MECFIDTLSILKLLNKASLGIRGNCSGGLVPSGPTLFPYDLTAAKTVHVIGLTLPRIKRPSQQQEIGAMDEGILLWGVERLR